MRKRWLALCCLVLTGCSTHPGANLLDHFFPGKAELDPRSPPHGGVCLPQGALPVLGVPVMPVPPGPPTFPSAAPTPPTILPPTDFVPPPPPAPLR